MYLAKEYWHAEAVAIGKHGVHSYVKVYNINLEEMRKFFNVKEFKKPSVNWIKFVIENRMSYDFSNYDVVIGPTADAHAQDEIEKFCRKHKSRKISIKEYKELIVKLKPYNYPIQIALLTQDVVDYVESKEVTTIIIR